MNKSVKEQFKTEDSCKPFLKQAAAVLDTVQHRRFLQKGLSPLYSGFVALDASRPWLFYWILNGLSLLGQQERLVSDYGHRAISSIKAVQHPDGGFGGGHGQIAHLAPTYAAILSLAIVGTEEAYQVTDRRKLYSWLKSLKEPNGGFHIHFGGEVDARAVYLALSVASLYNLLTPELTENTAQWLSRCQRYEGGMSGVHDAEAHGGLAFCAVAALCVLGSPKTTLKAYLDVSLLLDWLSERQMSIEGGFNGRTNKLVDGCYSWWVGGTFPLVEAALGVDESVFNREALSAYLLACCQGRKGGMRDKPEK